MRDFAPMTILAFASIANAQMPALIVNSRIKLPQVRAEGSSLVSSLDQFLHSMHHDAEKNARVYQPHLREVAPRID